MRILLLNHSLKEGHSSADEAIAEACDRRGDECLIMDPDLFVGEWAKTLLSFGYDSFRHISPKVSAAMHKAESVYRKTGLPSPLYIASAIYAENLNTFVVQQKVDAILCTHPRGIETIAAAKSRGLLLPPCFAFITEYCCNRIAGADRMDRVFIPHTDARSDFLSAGVQDDKIRCVGFPVSERFEHHIGKENARNFLVLPHDKSIYLIDTKGMREKEVLELLDSLLKSGKKDFVSCVLVDRENERRENWQRRYAKCSGIRIITYTEKRNLYMEAADVLFARSGERICTEAVAVGTPLILFMQTQEESNSAFYLVHKMASAVTSIAEAVKTIIQVADDPSFSGTMLQSQLANTCQHAADRITEEIAIAI